jgi:hypothetical protein
MFFPIYFDYVHGLDKGVSTVPYGDDRPQAGVQPPVQMVVKKQNPEGVTHSM